MDNLLIDALYTSMSQLYTKRKKFNSFVLFERLSRKNSRILTSLLVCFPSGVVLYTKVYYVLYVVRNTIKSSLIVGSNIEVLVCIYPNDIIYLLEF